MANAQHISISAAARLLGKNRETIAKKVQGLPSVVGPKGAKLYDANDLMIAVYCGRDDAFTIWDLKLLEKAMEVGFEIEDRPPSDGP